MELALAVPPFRFRHCSAGDGSALHRRSRLGLAAPLLIGGVGECLALSGPGWAGGGGWSRFLRRGARSLLGPYWAGRPIVFVSYKLQISSLFSAWLWKNVSLKIHYTIYDGSFKFLLKLHAL